MTMSSPKMLIGGMPVARSRLSIVASVAGLAFFLATTSFLLSLSPVGLFSQKYQEAGVATPLVVPELSPDGKAEVAIVHGSITLDNTGLEYDSPKPGSETSTNSNEKVSGSEKEVGSSHGSVDQARNGDVLDSSGFKDESQKVGAEISKKGKLSEGGKEGGSSDGSIDQNSREAVESSAMKDDPQKPSSEIDNKGKLESGTCDLYNGKWFFDSAGPLYTNNTCPFITQMQNCQANGRPDKDYENYRWKPDQCELPRFDPKKFLELMRGKTLAFIGDSVARNQMESMLCILFQAEAPKNRGNRKMQRWYFRSTDTMIVRIWSSWLVHQNDEPFQSAPKGVTKVFLDVPDETFMEHLPSFDVVVLSSGHWFAKQSAYVLNNAIVGGQLWWPKDAGEMKMNNVEAFGVSVETSMAAIANHPNFKGLAIVRSFSPDHYEGGAWNTGGSCTGKVKPVDEVVRNGFTDVMREKQITGFQRAVEKSGAGGSRLRMMDITEMFAYRADGHPGPYRSLDPNKITKRGPHGEPPPQDCLHWCMPGPVDTWNEILMETIRREFESS